MYAQCNNTRIFAPILFTYVGEAVRITGNDSCFHKIFVRNVFRSVNYLASYARSALRNASGPSCEVSVIFALHLIHNEQDSVKLYNICFHDSSFCIRTD